MQVSAAAIHPAVRRALTRALSDPAGLADLAPGELDFALRVVRRAQLVGRIAWQLRDGAQLSRFPQTAQDALSGALAITNARARVASWELDRLARALMPLDSVPLVALKGCAYMLLALPNSRGRFFADVDLLVPEAELGRIEAQLTSRGWLPAELTAYDDNYYRLWTHELPPLRHTERQVEIDLHHSVLMRTARLRPNAQLLLANARRVPGSRFSVLAPVDMTLHAMTHLFYGGEMNDALRELVDIDQLIRHFAVHEPGFWEQFWPRAVELDLAPPAYYGLRYAARLLNTPVPDTVLKASPRGAPSALSVWVMDRVVPRALFPQHPDKHTLSAATARLLLYMRSHWVRMPTLMLMRHLARKFYVRRLSFGKPHNE